MRRSKVSKTCPYSKFTAKLTSITYIKLNAKEKFKHTNILLPPSWTSGCPRFNSF
jgi:hypothetical protein